jgi:hypothetical protein
MLLSAKLVCLKTLDGIHDGEKLSSATGMHMPGLNSSYQKKLKADVMEGYLEYDRKLNEERQEKKRKFEAECLQEDRSTAAKRLKEDNKTTADRLREDKKTTADRLEEDKEVKNSRNYAMIELNEPLMTSTIALTLLGLSSETQLTMEDIYAEYSWRMEGFSGAIATSMVDILETARQTSRLTHARDVLLDYTVKLLALDVSVPPMDNKQAAAVLEISESANHFERQRALCRMLCYVQPPKNGLERFIREKTIEEAMMVMHEYVRERVLDA